MGGELEVINSATNQAEKVEVKLIPTPYAGGREKRMKFRDDNLGSPRELAIDSFSTSGNKLDVGNFFDKETNEKINDFVNRGIKENPSEKNPFTGYVRGYIAFRDQTYVISETK